MVNMAACSGRRRQARTAAGRGPDRLPWCGLADRARFRTRSRRASSGSPHP